MIEIIAPQLGLFQPGMLMLCQMGLNGKMLQVFGEQQMQGKPGKELILVLVVMVFCKCAKLFQVHRRPPQFIYFLPQIKGFSNASMHKILIQDPTWNQINSDYFFDVEEDPTPNSTIVYAASTDLNSSQQAAVYSYNWSTPPVWHKLVDAHSVAQIGYDDSHKLRTTVHISPAAPDYPLSVLCKVVSFGHIYIDLNYRTVP